MPVQANITNKQSIDVNIQSTDGANRMIICAGRLDVFLSGGDNTASGNGVSFKETFTALIDPQLESGQFKRALATASFADIGYFDNDPTQRDGTQWRIDDVQADFDDESGQVELRVSLEIIPRGIGSSAFVRSISFQVTTIAIVQGQ